MRFTLFTLFAVLAALLASALAVPVAPARPGSLMGRRFVVSDAPRALAAAAAANPATPHKDASRTDRFQRRLAQRAGVLDRSAEEAREQAAAPRQLAIAAVKARALGRRARRSQAQAQ
ncbi:hypothetical protein HDZ31DRAFT_66220 [Schizophyllum fasciatum]